MKLLYLRQEFTFKFYEPRISGSWQRHQCYTTGHLISLWIFVMGPSPLKLQVLFTHFSLNQEKQDWYVYQISHSSSFGLVDLHKLEACSCNMSYIREIYYSSRLDDDNELFFSDECRASSIIATAITIMICLILRQILRMEIWCIDLECSFLILGSSLPQSVLWKSV